MRKQVAVFAGGCFWCTEAIFLRLQGVMDVKPGYAGGDVPHPSYDEVCTGKTGHAEAIRIEFDSEEISYQTLLDVFWHTHDPTTYNRQGNDVGSQYRSVIFYYSEEQKLEAKKAKAALEKSGEFRDAIVTEIVPFTNFYEAENYHQNYFENHKDEAYCSIVIDPKITKLLTKYRKHVKPAFQKSPF